MSKEIQPCPACFGNVEYERFGSEFPCPHCNVSIVCNHDCYYDSETDDEYCTEGLARVNSVKKAEDVLPIESDLDRALAHLERMIATPDVPLSPELIAIAEKAIAAIAARQPESDEVWAARLAAQAVSKI